MGGEPGDPRTSKGPGLHGLIPPVGPWMVDSDQPDQRAWAPSRGLPQAGGGQNPGPADWPAPRKAPGPQTWQRKQRRKAVSDRQGALDTGTHSRCLHSQTHVYLTHKAVPPMPDTLAHTPTHTGLAPTSVISNRPTTNQSNAKPQNLLSISALQTAEASN